MESPPSMVKAAPVIQGFPSAVSTTCATSAGLLRPGTASSSLGSLGAAQGAGRQPPYPQPQPQVFLKTSCELLLLE